MLKTLRKSTGTKGAGALAVALIVAGTAAQADWHTIEIDDGAYMPTISYIGSGDNVIFTNETAIAHTITGADGSWTTGAIEPGGRYVHYVNKNLPLVFSGVAVDGATMSGEYSYEPAPLDEVEPETNEY